MRGGRRRGLGAGDLDQRVTLERKTRTPDGYGGYDPGWTAQGTLWAGIEAVRGQERLIADREASVATYRVIVHNSGIGAGVTVDDRLIWGAVELNVRRAEPGQRGVYRTLEAESEVPS